MPTKVEVWRCDDCHFIHMSEASAEKCEESHAAPTSITYPTVLTAALMRERGF